MVSTQHLHLCKKVIKNTMSEFDLVGLHHKHDCEKKKHVESAVNITI